MDLCTLHVAQQLGCGLRAQLGEAVAPDAGGGRIGLVGPGGLDADANINRQN